MVVFSNDTRCAIQQYTSQGSIHIRGDILLQTSCFIDHMLQGFSRLRLQISRAAPDRYLETPGAEGDTDIYPFVVPSSLTSFPSSLALHTDQSWAKYLQRIKDVANLWPSVLLSRWVSSLIVWCKFWYSWHKHMVSLARLLVSLACPFALQGRSFPGVQE